MSLEPPKKPDSDCHMSDEEALRHETLTSLTVVLGFASLLQRRAAELPDEQRERFLPQLEALEQAARDLMHHLER